MLRDFLTRRRVSSRPRSAVPDVEALGWGERPPTPPVDDLAWAALLVGRKVQVPCHFAGGSVRWGCARSATSGCCQRVVLHEVPSAEQGAEQGAEHGRFRGSDSIHCSGPMSIVCTFEGDLVIAACWGHEDWLRRHDRIDGMNSGVICSQGKDGTWQLVVEHPFAGATKRWRISHPGWEAIDAADRATIAAMFPPTEQEVHTDASVPWIERRLRYLASEAGMILPDEIGTLELVPRDGSHGATIGHWRDAEDFIAAWAAEGRRWADLNLNLDPASRPRLVYEVEPDVTSGPLPDGSKPVIIESAEPLPSTIPG